ncbi:MAG: PAS domain-containing protein [Rhodospirillaceae bacterium]
MAAHQADLGAHRPFRGFEYEFLAKNGKVIRVRISGIPLFDPRGKFLEYRGIGTDITGIVEKVKTLRETEDQFRVLIDNLPSFVNLKNRDGQYLLINRKHTEIPASRKTASSAR